MRKDIYFYCKSCKACQLRSRILTTDRVPIAPVMMEQIPFRKLNMDVIGPILPPSSAGHKYVLCMVDSCTRFSSIMLLKNLTAKSVGDSLLTLFVNVGVQKLPTASNWTAD